MKLLFIDPQKLACLGIQLVLESQTEVELVGTASNRDQAINLANEHHPELIMIDANLPTFLGFALAEELRKISPHSKFIFNIGYPVRLFVAFLMNFSADSIITFDTRCDQYLELFRHLNRDEKYYDINIKYIVDDITIRKYLTANELHFTSLLSMTEFELMAYYSSPKCYCGNVFTIAKQFEEEKLLAYKMKLYKKFNVRSENELKEIFRTILVGTTIEELYW